MSSASLAAADCNHCGISFLPKNPGDRFCCSGCHFVHDLIQGEGFADFYQLLGRKGLNPLNDQPTTPATFDWLKEATEGKSEYVLNVGNLTCTACVWLIERLFRKQKGALRLAVDINRSAVTIWWDSENFDPVQFAKELHRFGYPVSEREITDEDIDVINHSESRALLTRLGVTFGLAMNTMAFTLPAYVGLEFSDSLAGLFRLVAFTSATLALAVGGSYFFQRAGAALRAGVLHLDIPISIGLIVAFLGSLGGLLAGIESLMYFDFVATFSALMLAGRWLHIRLIEKNRRDLRAREKQILLVKKRNTSGAFESIKPDQIEAGDEIEVGPGSLIPVNGNLLAPESIAISMDWINGEPAPLQCDAGQKIPAGSRNATDASLRLLTQSAFSGSLIEKLLTAVPAPAETVGRSKVLAIYLYAVLAVALVGAGTWYFNTGDIVLTLQVLISVLVVSCPCALGLALPLVDEILNSRMRRNGVFVRSGEIWRKLPGIKKLTLDKTGTLTELVPKLLNPESLDQIADSQRPVLAALVNANLHPHSAAIREAMIQRFGPASLSQPAGIRVRDLPGNGMQAEIGGDDWKLGKASWATRSETAAPTTVFTRNGDIVASFEFGETIRDGAAQEIAALHREGYQTEILSGDPDRARVLEIGKQIGIPPTHIYSSYSPEQKAEHIAADHPETMLFIGDGGNDSLALETAACSGSPATGIRAIESKTDFVFVGRSFQAVRRLFHAARRRRQVVKMVFFVAVLYNLIAVGLCLAGLMNPLLAAVLMPLSSIVTTAIATRV